MNKTERDRVIQRAVAGEGVGFSMTHIEEGYFARERKENAIAQGIAVEMPELVSTDIEYIIKRSERLLSAVENDRVARRDIVWPDREPEYEAAPPQKKIILIEL